jgi:hypothetical protein
MTSLPPNLLGIFENISPADREKIITGEYYHIFNRGVEKRRIFNNKNDFVYVD